MKNRIRDRCTACQEFVEPGGGELEKRGVDENGKPVWVVTHDGGCPTDAAVDGLARWAVYCRGRTPAGNQARGVRIVESAERPTAGTQPAVALDSAAHSADSVSLEQVAAGSAVGRQWLAFWWLEGLRPRPDGVTMDDIDAMLGDADVAAMRRQVDEGRRRILGGMEVST